MPSERRRVKPKSKSQSRNGPSHSATSTSKSGGSTWQLYALGLVAALVAFLCYRWYDSTGRLPSIAGDSSNNNWDLDNESVFRIVELEGRGKGAIAARDIKQGELLLRERPLFVVPRQINSSPTAFIAGELNKLLLNESQAFWNLSYVNFPKDLDPLEHPEEVALAVFQTNAVAAGENVGIFPRMARLNHGCAKAFNVVYNWREWEGALVVFALRDINKGEELLTTYTNTKRPRDERRAFLSQQYGFHCTCSVCSLPNDLSKASDQRLSEISRLYEIFKTWGSKIDGVEAIQHIRKIWELEEEEGYWSERGQLAADAAWVAASHSDAAATQAWAQAAQEWFSFEIGADTPQVTEMGMFAHHPGSHRAWGTREKLKVGGPNWQCKFVQRLNLCSFDC